MAASNNEGGLVGINDSTVSNSYATGSVSGSGNIVGGLAGINGNATSTISNSYATGSVNGTANDVGGLVGENDGTDQQFLCDRESDR